MASRVFSLPPRLASGDGWTASGVTRGVEVGAARACVGGCFERPGEHFWSSRIGNVSKAYRKCLGMYFGECFRGVLGMSGCYSFKRLLVMSSGDTRTH